MKNQKKISKLTVILQFQILFVSAQKSLKFSREPSDVVSLAGNLVELQCSLEETIKKGICKWTKDGVELETEGPKSRFPRYSKEMNDRSACNLNIFPALPEDDGSYQCHIESNSETVISKEANLVVNAPPGQPFILQAKVHDKFEVLEGEEIVLDCETIGAKPAAKILWKDEFDNQLHGKVMETVHEDPKYKTYRTISSMRFKISSDVGITCVASSDGFPEQRKSKKLEIKMKHSPKASLNITDKSVQEGNSLKVKCFSEAFPSDVTYKWFINDEEQKDTEDLLVIENVDRRMNEARIACHVQNSIGLSKVISVLNVTFPPQFIEEPKSTVSVYGEKVKLTCEADSNPAPHYIWVKGERQDVVGASKQLTFTANEESEGDYQCKLFYDGKDHQTSKPAKVQILRKPEVFTESVKFAALGEDIILQCRVESLSNKTKITWTKNSEPIDYKKMKHRILHTEKSFQFASDLIIYKVDEDDFAEYGCFSSNEVGTDYKMFSLREETGDFDYLSITLAVNSVFGIIILVVIIVFHKMKNRPVKESENQVERGMDPPPAYMVEDPALFNSLLGDRILKEESSGLQKNYTTTESEVENS